MVVKKKSLEYKNENFNKLKQYEVTFFKIYIIECGRFQRLKVGDYEKLENSIFSKFEIFKEKNINLQQ